jgi:hypothetical protein
MNSSGLLCKHLYVARDTFDQAMPLRQDPSREARLRVLWARAREHVAERARATPCRAICRLHADEAQSGPAVSQVCDLLQQRRVVS